MRSAPVRLFLAFSEICAVVARWAAIALSMTMIVCLLLQIFFRYVVGSALTWSEEMALLSFAWVVLLLASVGVREGFHVRLTLFLGLLPGPLRGAMERLILLAIGAFAVFLTVSGYRYLMATRGQISAAVGYPTELLHASGMVCGALIAVQVVARLLLGPVEAKDPELADQDLAS